MMRKTRASPERLPSRERALYQVYRVTRVLDQARDAIPRNWLTTVYCAVAVLAGAGAAFGVYLLTVFVWLATVALLTSAWGLQRLNKRLERRFTADATRIRALEVDLGLVAESSKTSVTALGEALNVVQGCPCDDCVGARRRFAEATKANETLPPPPEHPNPFGNPLLQEYVEHVKPPSSRPKDASRSCRWHKWQDVRWVAANTYQECTKCRARRVRGRPSTGGYAPIDTQWLGGGPWFDPATQVFESQKASGVVPSSPRAECQHNWQFIVRTDGVLIGKRCRDCGWWEQ